ncbi:MAG: CoA ester lyase [Chloroflexi bacterium]|nr:CoA ester lyase [Chloroflexota bacterium]
MPFADHQIRRVLLFMPGDSFKKITKGASLGVDSIIMDLEDGVALNRKPEARRTVTQALTSGEIDFGATERLVRVNQPRKGMQAEDIAATIVGRPDGYVLPKVESARDIQLISHALLERELLLGMEPGMIKLLAIIETARGVVNLREIAAADQRLVALIFGAEDLVGDIGAVRSRSGAEVFYARSAVVIHAAAFGLQAIDTPFIDLDDVEGLRVETTEAMHMGYTGKLAIHPRQVAPIVDVFTPTADEIAAAQKLIAAHEEHQASGEGAFAYEGKMIDMPMIRAAERVIARARTAGII